MTFISYKNFARMRLREFFRADVELELEESGWITLVGLGGYEGLGETRFCWRQGEPFQTAGIQLDLELDSLLPDPLAERIINSLGLPIRRGMSAADLISIFGKPQTDKPGKPCTRLLYFVCGTHEQYILGCDVNETRGLVSFFLARKDYCDASNSI